MIVLDKTNISHKIDLLDPCAPNEVKKIKTSKQFLIVNKTISDKRFNMARF